MGINNLSITKDIIENEKLFDHIAKINFLNIWSEFIQRQKLLLPYQLKNRNYALMWAFSRMAAAYFDVEGITEQGKKIPFIVQIYAKTLINLFDKDIIENIRKNWSLDLLDIEFTYSPEKWDYTEAKFGDEKFFKSIKDKIIARIKEDPKMEHVIVENYCDILNLSLKEIEDSKRIYPELEKIQQELVDIVSANTWEKEKKLVDNEKFRELKTRKEILFSKLWPRAPLELKLYMDTIEDCWHDIYENMLKPIEEWKKTIPINSKYLYMDNGDTLYSEIAEKGEYRRYYQAELSLLKNMKKKLWLYIHKNYISLWCGNGKKDKLLVEAAKMRYEKHIHWKNNELPFAAYQNILLIDGSLKSLTKAGNIFDKELPIINKQFSVGRINDILKKWRLYTNLKAKDTHMLLFQNTIYSEEFKKSEKTLSLFWGTFWNFWSYQIPFLKEIDQTMKKWDTFIISLFNKPKNEEEKRQTEAMYDTKEEHELMANFFQKIGIKKDNIKLQVRYDENDVVDIDVKIERKDNVPVIGRVGWKEVEIPDGTIFQCVQSERFDKRKFNNLVENNTNLTIKDSITEENSPFTCYILEKK